MENDVIELDVYLSIVKYHFLFITALYFEFTSIVENINFNSCSGSVDGFLFEYIAKEVK